MTRKEIIDLAISHAHGAIEQFDPTAEYLTVWSYRDNLVDCLKEANVTDTNLWDLALRKYAVRVNYLAARAKLGRKFEI